MARRRVSNFRKDEDGAMMILTLFIFIFMLVMAGLGIDSMRHEMHRAHLQATLDSAVLAGAGASSEEEAKHVVEDYFAKAGMSEYLNAIGEDDIDIGLNSAYVTASAQFEMDTYLMKLSGVDRLSTAAEATAMTRVPKLEIALVLDVSNSMNQNGTNRKSKMENLQKAAKEFVTTILETTDPGNATISIVPFSTSVTPSQDIYDALLVDERHDYSNCLWFDEDDYDSTALATDAAASEDLSLVPMKQAIYTSRFGDFENLDWPWRSCYTEDGYRVMQFSTSETDLHDKIDEMIAHGNTSGELGVKWGAALLDPSFRDVTGTTVPVDYSDSETMKIIVMMGDGENSTTYFFPQDSKYRGENSDLFEVEYEVQEFDYAYYIYNANYRWYGSSNEWRCSQWYANCKYKSVTYDNYVMRDPEYTYGPGLLTTVANVLNGVSGSRSSTCQGLINAGHGSNGSKKGSPPQSWSDNDCDAIEDDIWDALMDDYMYLNVEDRTWINGTDFVNLDELDGFKKRKRLSWEEAWGLMSPEEYGDLIGIRDADNEYEDMSSNLNGSKKNTRMDKVCSAAKDNGVVIYTIGYEVPKDGTAETSLKKCATGYDPVEGSTAYYYSVDGLDISDAFGSIAGNVQALRLTQ
ncbi:TadE/TadG family type IV pilus assembly protein [Roseovarius sp. THAF27]|uniref:TadE/TadG family type IV pilus assembly protein n=1 Tax=Roseovarius sp. THAF27 TaxID=2587850 RepID=UPI001562A10F|nr:TadE/TadG family type IV pilus assembly protein [Roseovarius sp. THAF27]